jgi:hypothetical protein
VVVQESCRRSLHATVNFALHGSTCRPSPGPTQTRQLPPSSQAPGRVVVVVVVLVAGAPAEARPPPVTVTAVARRVCPSMGTGHPL